MEPRGWGTGNEWEVEGLVLWYWATKGFPTDGFSLHSEVRDVTLSCMGGLGGSEAWKGTGQIATGQKASSPETERERPAPP